MKTLAKCILCIVLISAVAGGAGPTPAPAPTPNKNASWDDYRLVLNRNIFSKDRRSREVRVRNGFDPAPPQYRAEDFLVLTGVVVQGDLHVAFLEDKRTGESVRVPAGKTLGKGTVEAVTIDGMDYRLGNAARHVSIGDSLTGVTATVAAASVSAPPTPGSGDAAPTVSSTGGPTSGPSAANLNDVAERMRLRRLQGN